MAGLADYQFGCTDAFRSEGFLICGNGRLVGVAAPASHLLMRWGHKQTSGPLLCAKAV